MAVIVLKLSGPLQSWGASSRYSERRTRHEPTKSGVVGLLAAALGRRREEDISDLACCRTGVRTDQPGVLVRDFQTSHMRKYDKTSQRWKSTGDPYVTTRHYLSDAVFLAGIAVPEERVEQYADALVHPAFPLFLGRRSCPPACKVLFGVYDGEDVESVLAGIPWQATSRTLIGRHRQEEQVSLDLLLDIEATGDNGVDETAHYEDVHDAPISYSQLFRQYEWRRVVHTSVSVPNPHCIKVPVDHDPFAAFKAGE